MSRRISWEAEQGLVDLPADYGKRKRRTYPEDQVQRACVAYLRILGRTTHDQVRFIVMQPERFRTLAQQRRDKERGLQAGTPELLILDVRKVGGPRVILVELKAPKTAGSRGGAMSEAQLEWQGWCIAHGYDHHVCDNVDDFKAILEGF
jgi:hypothetical protein